MATALTVFTIITGIASLLGFAFVFFGGVTAAYKRVCAWSLGAAGLWSAYVLLVPNSAVEANVAGKLAYYRTPTVEHESSSVMVQRGGISFSGTGPISVEFPVPFLNTPRVEIINTGGYDDYETPKIREATPHQVTFYRSSTGGIGMPQGLQTYHWVARGTPLDPPGAGK